MTARRARQRPTGTAGAYIMEQRELVIIGAGDVRDTALRQVVTAAGDGARAAMSAYAYLAEQE